MKRTGIIVTFLIWIGTTFGLLYVIGYILIKSAEHDQKEDEKYQKIKEENIRLKSKYEFFEKEA